MSDCLILDGKKRAEEIKHELRHAIVEGGLTPSLAIVLVGDDPASHLYIKLKEKAAQQVGIAFHKYLLPADSSEQNILETIDWLNQDQAIDAILVQLPLPQKFDEDSIIAHIDPCKDADGFLAENINKLQKQQTKLRPAPAQAVVDLVHLAQYDLAGKYAVVIANNDIFSKPIQILLEQDGMAVEYISPENAEHILEKAPLADVLIVAVGKPNFITDSHVKDDAIVIDVGTNRIGDEVVGDVDFAAVRDIVGAITPVPGGVGPMTIACLLQNVVTLHKQYKP